MKRVIALFLVVSFFSLFSVTCAQDDRNVIKVDPSRLRNGSTSIYTLYDEKGKTLYTFRDNIFLNPDNILIIRELTEENNEEVFRVKLDPEFLSPISIQIVKSEKQSEKPKLFGEKRGRSYLITEWDDNNNPSYKRLYIGSNQFFEDEVLLHVISCFPLNVGDGKEFEYVNTRKKISGYERYNVVGSESVSVAKDMYESIKIEIPGNNCIAWYLKDNPHILLKAKFPSSELCLTGWNNI